jgi:predicted ester cyclase
MAKASTSKRVERIRKMYAGEEDPDLFSSRFLSHAPWDLAGHKSKAAPRRDKFRAPGVFSETKITIIKAVEKDNTVVVRWRMRGKWSGPLPFAPDLKPTGKAIDVTGTNTYTFDRDKIVKKTGDIDGFTLAKQMFGGSNISMRGDECVQMLEAVSRPPEILVVGGQG